MKITRLETLPVHVPLRKGMMTKTAHGEHVLSKYVLLRVHTDEGLVGLGEATVDPRWTGETPESAIAVIHRLFEPVLTGRDPRNITSLRAAMDFAAKQNPFTKAAVEMALWDLASKAAGVPVCQLLGGAVRERIAIKMVVGAFDTPRALKLAEQFLSQGFRTIKVKVGLDPAADVDRVRAVRELAGPNVPIGIDANCGWSPSVARSALRRMEPYELLFAEQPIPPGDPSALARLRTATSASIMADESVFTLADAWLLARAYAADVLSVYPGKHGGIAGTVEIVHLAQAAGIACCIGSNLELGVGSAAMLHVAAAMPGIDSDRFPADIIGPLYHEHDLLRQPLELSPDGARVPTGPGLGVELDEDQLKQCAAT